jgi:pSer/pThr/pTyr-binding forkhead associated (FHA) protein
VDRLATLELKIVSGPKAGEIITLSSGELVFGRTQGDVVTSWDRSTSSRHFKIEKNVDRFVLNDLGSTNGTFVNGKAVNTCQLNDADRIQIGDTFFSVQILNSAATERPFNSEESSAFFDPYANVVTAPKRKKVVETQPPAEACATDGNAEIRQVRLRIMSSTEQGTLYWLGPGQTLVFGRTAKSDCCLAFDATLSSRHFSVTCSSDRCELADLGSSAGTFLNGRHASKDRLFNGDQVKAGLTVFTVEVEGANGPIVRTGEAAIAATAAANAMPVVTLEVSEVNRFRCASGLIRIRGKLADPEAIIGIFDVLQQTPTLYFLIDFSRIGLPLPAAIDVQACMLFPWVPAVAASQTPLLVKCEELPEWKAYVEEAWGSDALVGIQSVLSKDELLNQLQERLTESSHGPAAAQGIIGFCWPSVLESLLENNLHGFVERFFESATLVLTEVAGDAESWQTYSNEEPSKFLKALQVKLVDTPAPHPKEQTVEPN